MQQEQLLAYDLGTSGVKASIIAADGTVVGTQTESYPTHYARGGIAEQNALDWWSGICRATQALIGRSPDSRTKIAAIGVSGHMLGCVPIGKDLEPLHPHLLHSDSRAAAQYAQICRDIGAQRLYQMSGNILDARSSLCKILWFRQCRPEIYEKTEKFLQSKDYIIARLTGDPDTTDYSDASHGELMNITTRSYEPELFRQLGVDMEKLPALHRSCDIVGRVTQASAGELGLPAGIPVIAGGGDGACGSAGAGNLHPGDAYLSLGTTAWIATVTEKPVIDPQQRLFNIMNLDGLTSSVYGTMQAAGASVNWVRELLGVGLDEMNRLAAEVEPGCEGLVYLPYLDGERSPVFDAQASGVFAGVNQIHKNGHFCRAVFEGVAYALRQIADAQREFLPLTRVHAIGGGMKSTLWSQIIADVTRLELQTIPAPAEDATSLGIAAVAGSAVGIFESIDQALARFRPSGAIHPGVENAKYEHMYQAYTRLYPALRETMHFLRQQ